jgi:hypothetical protein
MGVHCSAGTAYFSVVDDGVLLDDDLKRMSLPAGEQSKRLQVFVDDLARTMRERKVDAVGVLKAEGLPPNPSQRVNVPALQQRTTLETLIQLAAVQADVDVEMLERATVRSRLGLGKAGRLEEMLEEAAPGMTGLYWAAGRGLAAVAARAKLAA